LTSPKGKRQDAKGMRRKTEKRIRARRLGKKKTKRRLSTERDILAGATGGFRKGDWERQKTLDKGGERKKRGPKGNLTPQSSSVR